MNYTRRKHSLQSFLIQLCNCFISLYLTHFEINAYPCFKKAQYKDNKLLSCIEYNSIPSMGSVMPVKIIFMTTSFSTDSKFPDVPPALLDTRKWQSKTMLMHQQWQLLLVENFAGRVSVSRVTDSSIKREGRECQTAVWENGTSGELTCYKQCMETAYIVTEGF
jgi:hypothetical protein